MVSSGRSWTLQPQVGGANDHLLAEQESMKFKSTRGSVVGVSFEQAVLSGCAGDGGLFMPETFPTVSREGLRAWSTLSYPKLVEKILRLFIDQDEMSDQDIRGTHSHTAQDANAEYMHTLSTV